jgi:hypothetical protein
MADGGWSVKFWKDAAATIPADTVGDEIVSASDEHGIYPAVPGYRNALPTVVECREGHAVNLPAGCFFRGGPFGPEAAWGRAKGGGAEPWEYYFLHPGEVEAQRLHALLLAHGINPDGAGPAVTPEEAAGAMQANCSAMLCSEAEYQSGVVAETFRWAARLVGIPSPLCVVIELWERAKVDAADTPSEVKGG